MKQEPDYVIEKQVAAFEGLVFSTAARYAPFLDDDADDVQQLLRLAVWKALRHFDPKRARSATTREERKEIKEKYVFSCVRNRVKDILQAQDRRNAARGGMLQSVDAKLDGELAAAFERDHFSDSDERVFACVDESDFELPSSLSERERQVVQLLTLDFSRVEIARLLSIPERRVRTTLDSVRLKMADWKPGASPSLQLASENQTPASSAQPFARAA